MKALIYSLLFVLVFAIPSAQAQDPAYDPNTPPSSSWIASMKINGASYWLRYTATTDEQVKKTEEALKGVTQNEGPGNDPPAAKVWLERVKAAKASPRPPLQLGKIEISAEGNVKAGAAKIETYANGESAEHMYVLGHLYYHGIGVTKDLKRAHYWFGQAQHAGMAPNPWVVSYVQDALDASAAAIKAEEEKEGGKRKKVEFRMPGEQGAPNVGGPPLRMDMAGNPGEDVPQVAMPEMEEGLTLYPPPYPEE